jgi:hypothetical protein
MMKKWERNTVFAVLGFFLIGIAISELPRYFYPYVGISPVWPGTFDASGNVFTYSGTSIFIITGHDHQKAATTMAKHENVYAESYLNETIQGRIPDGSIVF